MIHQQSPDHQRIPPALDKDGPDLANWLSEFRERWATFVAQAAGLAALILDTCDTCGKPDSVLWFRMGQHDTCERLERHAP